MSSRHSERSERRRKRRHERRKRQQQGPKSRKRERKTRLPDNVFRSECGRCGEPVFRDGVVVWRACTTCGTRFPFAQFQVLMLIMGGIFGVGSVAAVMGKIEEADIIWFFPMILGVFFLMRCITWPLEKQMFKRRKKLGLPPHWRESL
jgi:uncharacterized protein (DUF983 family)